VGFQASNLSLHQTPLPHHPLDPILIIDTHIAGWVAYMNSSRRSEIVERLVARQRGASRVHGNSMICGRNVTAARAQRLLIRLSKYK
jgi:hypothetical protein